MTIPELDTARRGVFIFDTSLNMLVDSSDSSASISWAEVRLS